MFQFGGQSRRKTEFFADQAAKNAKNTANPVDVSNPVGSSRRPGFTAGFPTGFKATWIPARQSVVAARDLDSPDLAISATVARDETGSGAGQSRVAGAHVGRVSALLCARSRKPARQSSPGCRVGRQLFLRGSTGSGSGGDGVRFDLRTCRRRNPAPLRTRSGPGDSGRRQARDLSLGLLPVARSSTGISRESVSRFPG